jgi:release factor glutamine methyltransferase
MELVDHLTEPDERRLDHLLAAARQLLGAALQRDAEILLAHVLGRPRSSLLAHGERRADDADVASYRALVARRAAGEPVAYLTGQREFWSLSLAVSPAVLIPRPETELVVERALVLLDEAPLPAATVRRVADLGTGSGAIALALASARPSWAVSAADRSAAALEIARRNAATLGLSRIETLAGDWFEPLAQRRFDLICSNPPYIAAGDKALVALRFEPAAALVAGPTGLEALRHLVAHAPAYLEPGGWLVLEHGHDQGAAVAAALVATGYARVRCHRDLAGHDRVTEAQWEN